MAVLPTPTNNILAPSPSPTIVSSQPQPQPLQALTSHADMIQPPPQPTPPVASTATDHSTHPAQRHPLLHLLNLIVLRNVPSTHHVSIPVNFLLTCLLEASQTQMQLSLMLCPLSPPLPLHIDNAEAAALVKLTQLS